MLATNAAGARRCSRRGFASLTPAYAGTEPSRLFRSDDGGDTWRGLRTLLELPSRPTWSFPPRPWTFTWRWIAPSSDDAELLLLGIELGGLMRSTDAGETWSDHARGAQRDVHSLRGTRRGRAYEAAGGGAAWSDDPGETWQPADEAATGTTLVGRPHIRPTRTSGLRQHRPVRGARRRARRRGSSAAAARRLGTR